MDQDMISRQIQISKMAFNNTFNSISIIQEQMDRMIRMYIAQVPMIPVEGKKVFLDWANTCKKVTQMSLDIYSHDDEDGPQH